MPKHNKKRHTILIVDDERSVLSALERTFKTSYNVLLASSGTQAWEIFQDNLKKSKNKEDQISLVISDQKMPEMTGVELLEKVKSISPDTVTIILTAYTETEDIIAAINRCDLYRYITKPWEDADIRLTVSRGLQSYDNMLAIKTKTLELEDLNSQLESANKNLLDEVEKRTKELVRANKELEKLAITDPLTKVNNRRYFEERLGKEFNRVKRYKHNLSIIMIDVDHFKQYNDLYGHLLGDSALKDIAEILSSNVRTSDFVARYGGEEFVLTLPETNTKGALEIAERIRKNVETHPFPTSKENESAQITISLGVATYTAEIGKYSELLKKADNALFSAKDGGRNKIVLCE